MATLFYPDYYESSFYVKNLIIRKVLGKSLFFFSAMWGLFDFIHDNIHYISSKGRGNQFQFQLWIKNNKAQFKISKYNLKNINLC